MNAWFAFRGARGTVRAYALVDCRETPTQLIVRQVLTVVSSDGVRFGSPAGTRFNRKTGRPVGMVLGASGWRVSPEPSDAELSELRIAHAAHLERLRTLATGGAT